MTRPISFLLILLLAMTGCSVISSPVRQQALSDIPFRTLADSGDLYIGETVILGGYILSTENKADTTVIEVIQSPLSMNHEPKAKDRTEGRFLVSHKGFLDPEVYQKDRKITVAGKIAGFLTREIGNCPYTCLQIDSVELYLWPKLEESGRDALYYYDPFFYAPWHYPYYYPLRKGPLYWYPHYPYW